MKLDDLAAWAGMFHRARGEQIANLERAIAAGRSKHPYSEVTSRRGSLPASAAIARALKLIAARRADLPADLVDEIEREAQR